MSSATLSETVELQTSYNAYTYNFFLRKVIVMPIRFALLRQGLLLIALALLVIQPANSHATRLASTVPVVYSVSPVEAYNYKSTDITITGSDFLLTPTVRLNNVLLPNVTFVDTTTITATVPADVPGGMYAITVTNPDSQSANLTSAFTVLMGGDGNLGTWQAASSMTTPRRGFAAVTQGTYLYALGGIDGIQALNSLERAAINADGTLGSWQVVSSMTTARLDFAAVVAEGFLYALGGNNGSWLSSVERAQINADGSLGSWQVVSSMTTPRSYFAAVVAEGFLYALGGYNGSSSLSSVERAQINADGSLSSWQVISSMTLDRYMFSAITVGGYFYALGGFGVNGTNLSSIDNTFANYPVSTSTGSGWIRPSPVTAARSRCNKPGSGFSGRSLMICSA